MRGFLYGCSLLLMFTATGAMAFLPRLVQPSVLFALVGTGLTMLISCAWLLLGASANGWVRPRTGQALMLAGFIGMVANLWSLHWMGFTWAGAVLVTGGSFLFPWTAKGRKGTAASRGQVQPPITRREKI